MKLNNIKRAYSFAQIVTIYFIIISTIFILYTKFFDTSHKYLMAYNWKKTVENVQYSYGVNLLTQKPELKMAARMNGAQRNFELMKLILESAYHDGYLINLEDREIKRYDYNFKNGKEVEAESQYYVEDFAFINDNLIVGMKWVNSDCWKEVDESIKIKTGSKNIADSGELCGVILFDINGYEIPNRFGVDVFGMDIYKDKIVPFGQGNPYNYNYKHCLRYSLGVTCSTYYLIAGKYN